MKFIDPKELKKGDWVLVRLNKPNPFNPVEKSPWIMNIIESIKNIDQVWGYQYESSLYTEGDMNWVSSDACNFVKLTNNQVKAFKILFLKGY